MPTQTFKRIWCKTCNEFTFHPQPIGSKELKCMDCDTTYTEVYLKEIPKEKILEQRQRYKEHKRTNFDRMFSGVLYMQNLFGPDVFDSPEIIESDAGQIRLDEIEREEWNKKSEERAKQREEERKEEKKYRNLGRNEICLCGSGLKYKKCCWSRIQKIQK